MAAYIQCATDHRFDPASVNGAKAALFGSVARDEALPTSDLDLLFEVDPLARFSLFDQARIEGELEDAIGGAVDFVPREGLRSVMRDRIERDLVRIF